MACMKPILVKDPFGHLYPGLFRGRSPARGEVEAMETQGILENGVPRNAKDRQMISGKSLRGANGRPR